MNNNAKLQRSCTDYFHHVTRNTTSNVALFCELATQHQLQQLYPCLSAFIYFTLLARESHTFFISISLILHNPRLIIRLIWFMVGLSNSICFLCESFKLAIMLGPVYPFPCCHPQARPHTFEQISSLMRWNRSTSPTWSRKHLSTNFLFTNLLNFKVLY